MHAPFETTPDPTTGFSWDQVGPDLLNFLADAGGKLITIAVIILSGLVLAWLMRRLIARIVDRIVRGAKNKAATDDDDENTTLRTSYFWHICRISNLNDSGSHAENPLQ